MRTKTCCTCQFWEKFGWQDTVEHSSVGECHRNAPQTIQLCQASSLGGQNAEYDAIWPETLEDEWCGEWKERTDDDGSGNPSLDV